METFYKEEGNTGRSKVVLTESNRQLIGCRGFDFFCFVYSHFPDSTLKRVSVSVALGNEAKVGDLVKPKKLNCIYFKTNNKQIMNNEEKGQICSKGHQRKERNSDWINKLGLKRKG